MKHQKPDDHGLTVLDTAIILIAIIVTAAVLASIAAGPPIPESRTGYNGGEQAKTIERVGDVYGLAADPSNGINEIRYTIRLVPGAQSMNLTTMKIIFSTPATSPVTLSSGTKASTSVFTARLGGTGELVSSISQDQQVEIDFLVADVPAGTRMNFDLRPPAGALSFFSTAPETITHTNVLR